MEIEKCYYTLPEILRRWKISKEDLAYLAENDRIRLSIRVFNMHLEFGDYEDSSDGGRCRMPWERDRYSGLLDLEVRDVYMIFRTGVALVNSFRTARAAYACLLAGHEPHRVLQSELLLMREERDRFEAEMGFAGTEKAGSNPNGFKATADYHEVSCNGAVFHFGVIQASVVRALHAAALAGTPWQNGKVILTAARSKSMRMTDVFKSQPNWRALIASDGRGAYRLILS